MRETRSTLTLCAALLLAQACGAIHNSSSSSSSSLTSDCVLNSDQSQTLTGRWQQPAVPIAFHAGDWNSSEIAAMIAAADNWNSFFGASMGYPAIDYGSAANPRTSTQGVPTDYYDFCAGSAIVNADYTYNGVVVIYKRGTWPYDSAIIAQTSVCNVGATSKKLGRSQNAYMEVNYTNFFVNGNRVPDLQSIVLHEMGHLMGINHSCSSSYISAGIPVCSNTTNVSYKSASMYPTFSFYSNGSGEIRRNLNDNDEGRMNCVYKYL